MATYVNNLRLKEITTGDESGTWGTSTNTNLELIGEALGIGTEAITTNADTHSTVVADGSADAGRAMYLKYTGALDSDCTITITPNTMKRVQIIENATSGSQNIIISQGSGANVTIGNGKVAIVQLDGAGSGAAVLDVLTDLQVTDTLSVNGTTITLGDGTAEDTKLVYDGNAKDFYIGLDDSADKLVIGDGSTVGTNSILTLTDDTVTIGDGAAVDTAIVFDGNAQDFYIALDDSADDLLIGLGSTVGTTPIISVDENKDVAIPDGGLTITTSDNTDQLSLVSTDADANVGPNIRMYRNSSSPADGDVLGAIEFEGRNDNSEDIIYAELFAETYDVSDGTEDGRFFIKTIVGGTRTHRMYMNFNETNFNEGGADLDFRVESNGNANMLFVDGGNDRVGIGTGTPSTDVHIYSTSDNAPHLLLENFQNADTDDAAVIELYLNDQTTGGIGDDTDVGVIRFTGDEKDAGSKETYAEIRGVAHDPGQGASNKGNLSFFVQAAGDLNETLTLDEKNVGIGTASPDTMLHVHTASAGSVTANSNTQLTIESDDHTGLQFLSPNDKNGIIYFGDAADNDVGYINYAHASNSMNFQTNTSVAMTIDSSGQVGISTTSPGALLDIGGGEVADPTILINSATGGDPTLRFDAGAANRSALIKFLDNGTNSGFIDYKHNGDLMNFGAGSSTGITASVGDGVFFVGATAAVDSERAAISKEGTCKLLIHCTQDSSARDAILSLHTYNGGSQNRINFIDGSGAGTGSGQFYYNHDGNTMYWITGGTENMTLDDSGNLTIQGSYSPSDGRLKENIEDFSYDIEKFKAYSPKTFDWINPEEHGGRTQQIGFIAQEQEVIDERFVEEVETDADRKDTLLLDQITKLDGDVKGISKTSEFVQKDAMYISVVQQLIERLETAEKQIEALKQQAHEKCEN